MLCQNIPISLVPRDQWDIRENVWEPLIEKSVFEELEYGEKTEKRGK